jgi:hypothetical protein
MGTSVQRAVTGEEVDRMPEARQAMADVGKAGVSTRSNFFAAFDGTNNDRDNLKLSGDPFPTNVARLQAQAKSAADENFTSEYFKGVGTGDDQGNIVNAAVNPTPAIDAAAERAYKEFAISSANYLRTNPDATAADLSASVTGFSRGCASAVRFAQLVNERGVVTADGTVVAPPGSVAVTGMALIDPVATGVKGEMGIPPNVKGQVLVVEGNDENRSHFRPLYYGDDPRVTTVKHPGNHVGVGGGYDRNGTAANVLEGVTGYFQNRGVPLADVPSELKHDPGQRPTVYTEGYATARNGDVLPDREGNLQKAWPLDDPAMGRIAVRPHMSDAHKRWLEKAYEDMAPALKARGLSDGQCARAALACVGAAAEHPQWGAPERFAVSKDGAQMAAVYKDGRFAEIAVDKALQTSAAEAVDQLAQSGRDGQHQKAPSGEWTQAREPEPALAR